jgi:Domain of unknown function (DUF1995)
MILGILLTLHLKVGLCFQPAISPTEGLLRKSTKCLSSSSMSSSSTSSSSTSTSNTISLPRDVKEAVSKCRQATQDALQRRISRMDVEFPVGTKFGVEKSSGKNSKAGRRKAALVGDEGAGDGGPTRARLDQSDRELARLYVDMFQPVGGDNIAVVFVDDALANEAKQQWKSDPTAKSQILAMNRRPGGDRRAAAAARKQKKKATKARGFASKLAAEIDDSPSGGDGSSTSDLAPSGPFRLPEGTEVALFVSPAEKELVIIDKICQEVGMGTLVVLLNARLSKIPKATSLISEEFEPVFSLSAAPQDVSPNCLLYRAYPSDWVLARKPKVGQPKTILTQPTKPTAEQCQAAYDGLEISDVEKNVEGIVENVAGWFR